MTVDRHIALAMKELATAEDALDRARDALGEAVRQAVESGGWTWAEVGRYFGVSKQAAHQRFGRSHH